MTKKKKREVPLEDIKRGPIRHKEGLTPLLEELARAIYEKVGRFVYPTFEQWELGFMRDMHPWREILIWETIARTFDLYVAEHPEAANSEKIVGTIVSISTGHESETETETEKELRKLFMEAHKKRWVPLLGEPFEFPSDEAPLLRYGDVVDERDGVFDPNLRGEIDCRRMLVNADIVIGMASTSGEHFCVYGRDHLEDGRIPEGFRTVIVRLDAENEDKHEMEKLCVIVKEIKGRHDYQ